MLSEVIAAEAPGDRLRKRPQAGALPVKTQLRGQTIQTVCNLLPSVAELEGADDWSHAELPLACEGLWIDSKPGLALGTQDILSM